MPMGMCLKESSKKRRPMGMGLTSIAQEQNMKDSGRMICKKEKGKRFLITDLFTMDNFSEGRCTVRER